MAVVAAAVPVAAAAEAVDGPDAAVVLVVVVVVVVVLVVVVVVVAVVVIVVPSFPLSLKFLQVAAESVRVGQGRVKEAPCAASSFSCVCRPDHHQTALSICAHCAPAHHSGYTWCGS